MKNHSVWVSDIHLGNPAAHVEKFIKFIDSVETRNFYLVGDIIDTGPQSLPYADWPTSHKLALDMILSLGESSEEAVYVYGNHDENVANDNFLIGFKGDFNNFDIKDSFVYKSVLGKRFYVFHGNQCDQKVQLSQIYLSPIKSIYSKLSSFSVFRNLKDKFKGVIARKVGYDNALISLGKENGCDGIITGHLHSPTIEKLNGIIFMNCGDWTGNNCAIAEDFEGNFEILR